MLVARVLHVQRILLFHGISLRVRLIHLDSSAQIAFSHPRLVFFFHSKTRPRKTPFHTEMPTQLGDDDARVPPEAAHENTQGWLAQAGHALLFRRRDFGYVVAVTHICPHPILISPRRAQIHNIPWHFSLAKDGRKMKHVSFCYLVMLYCKSMLYRTFNALLSCKGIVSCSLH